jgi:mRNA degradation ribonuclease J1/J2
MTSEPGPVLGKAAEAVKKALVDTFKKGECDITDVQQAIRNSVRRVIREEISRKPVVLPVVMEV